MLASSTCDPSTLALARSGDRRALESMLRGLRPLLLRMCRRLTANADDAEEVLQETLLTIAVRLDQFRSDARLETWAFAIARSHASRKYRRARPMLGESSDARELGVQMCESDENLERTIGEREIADRLGTALDQLGRLDRTLLVEQGALGRSLDEIGEIHGLTVSAVKARLHRARLAARSKIGHDFRTLALAA
jgi:RNA polymerase sigma-70 factor (ECF subfamily)